MSQNPPPFEKAPRSAAIEREEITASSIRPPHPHPPQYHNQTPGAPRSRQKKRNCSGPGKNISQFLNFPCQEIRSSVNPFPFSCCNFHNLTRTYKGRLLSTPTRFLKISTINHFVKMNGSTYCSL